MTETKDVRGGWTSASNAMADTLCPGRHMAQKPVPIIQKAANGYADAGTLIHAALAGEPGSIEKLSIDQRDVYERCKQIEGKLLADYFGAGSSTLPTFRHTRYWVTIQDASGKALQHSGEADFVARSGTRAMVLDYKSLMGDIPDGARNLQLRDLAVLVKGHFVVIKEVAVAIVQPLVSMDSPLCVYNEEELNRSSTELFERVIKSNFPGSPRKAGTAQCEFCRAKSYCVEYQQWIGGSMPIQMNTLMDVPMANWTPEQRGYMANMLLPASKFLEDMKQSLKDSIARDPHSVPGWTLKPGSRREAIKNPQVALDRFVGLGGTLEAFMPCITVNKSKLKEAVAGATKSSGKALENALKKLNEGNVDATQTAPMLAKVDE